VAGRTSEESAETRGGLVRAARELFAARGYNSTSIGALAAAAGVTRGALYHHFVDKRELFEAVVLDVQDEVVAATRRSASGRRGDPLASAIDRFLVAVSDPQVQQILLRDAPAVLGWPRWEHPEAASHVDLIAAVVEERVGDPMAARALAHLVGAALIEAALVVADANDPKTTLREMRAAIDVLVGGLVEAEPRRRRR
jgi:AcrR family transcriptional regulator